ncbi:MAG: TetR/AcrR family transcriptional regulator [Actinomycetota bacterium]|nr:TetR/AcrR family transcriptional regulator [Actinomycetota bacterium]
METGDEAAVSIRAIADAVGVSPPSIYLHFADKDELIHAVCQQQFRRLDVLVDQTLGDVADPIERLRRRGQAYVRFGVDHPEHYRIMLMGKSHFSAEDYERGVLPGMPSFMALVQNVQDCMDSGAFARDDPLVVATVLWAAVHGMTSLRIAVPGFPVFREADAIVDRLIDVLTRGLAPDPPARRRKRASRR